MDFDEILANCLDALERGETIEGCLARYPKYRSELAPLLRLATSIRSVPQPRLSAKAFERGRAAVRAQARYQQGLNTRFTAPPKKRQPADRLPPPKLPLPAIRSRPFSAVGLVQRSTRFLVALVLLLGLVTLLRNVSISLPGAPLYPTKMLGEAMQGVLLTAAGEQIAWQAQQTENRLQELVVLTQQGQTATPALLATIAADVQATLTASQRMPATERNEFLINWVDRLQAIKKNQALPTIAALTVDQTIATVATATQVTVAPAMSPMIQATSVAPVLPSAISPTPILVPTPDLASARELASEK